jgi:hypothetical protein
LVLGVVALVFAACGGDDGGGGAEGQEASADTDVDTLLEQTFTGSKEVTSGNLSLTMKLEAQGEGAEDLQGPVSLSLKGPFQSQGKGQLPKFKLDAAFEGAGQSISAGATSTGEKGYVSFQGTDYVLEEQIFQQFKAGFEEAQKQGGGQDQQQSFASLGMDPRKWLTDAKTDGEAKVGDTDTVKITGGVDMDKLLDDVNNALGKASSLGLGAAGGEVPEKLTDQQRQQVLDAVKDPKVEIYTGKDDSILRRLVVNLGIAESNATGTIGLDVSITDLNEDQDIAEPSDAKPFNELLGQLGGLGALGGAAGSGSGAADDGAAAGGGSSEDLEKYSQCLTDAGSDVEAARKCADLLTG